MPQQIHPMTDTERWIVSSAVKERYGREVAIQDVETEIRLYIDDRELTLCPGFYWNEHGCHFVLSKTGDSRYRSMFFYRPRPLQYRARGIRRYRRLCHHAAENAGRRGSSASGRERGVRQ